jgi:hypothetical protein
MIDIFNPHFAQEVHCKDKYDAAAAQHSLNLLDVLQTRLRLPRSFTMLQLPPLPFRYDFL